VNTALIIILTAVFLSAAIGLYAGRRLEMSLENWTVGGRRFGILLIWLLMAGEIYTTFTFLGASGWAYSRGAPTFYIMIYGTLAYAVSFFVLPEIWKAGRRFGLHTQPDFFVARYGSRSLGVFVALIGVISIIPYLQLQLQGLGLIVEVASDGAIRSGPAIVGSFLLTCAFVYTSGLRGAAWVAVVKDVLMIAAVGVVGFGVPRIYFGGFGRMFRTLAERFPGHLTFPGATTNMDTVWVMSTALLTGLGFYMWPHVFGSAFSAKSARTIRRNAMIMPFYQIPILLVFMVGFTALLVLPGLKNGDMAFLEIVRRTYPRWFMGFVGSAGAVTAMVPAAVLVLFASTLLTKNVYRAAFAPAASEEKILRLSRLAVLFIMAAALLFALRFPNALVNLLLIGYDGVSQFFPGVVLGLFWKRTSRGGVVAGLTAGVVLAAVLVFSGHDPFLGLNAGFVALAVNALVAILVSLAARSRGKTARKGGRPGNCKANVFV